MDCEEPRRKHERAVLDYIGPDALFPLSRHDALFALTDDEQTLFTPLPLQTLTKNKDNSIKGSDKDTEASDLI